MKFFVATAAFLLCSGMVQSSGNSAETTTEKAKTKPNRVWTNDEISGVGGNGAISVVGKAGGGDSNPSSKNFQKTALGWARGTSKLPLTAIAFIN